MDVAVSWSMHSRKNLVTPPYLKVGYSVETHCMRLYLSFVMLGIAKHLILKVKNQILRP
jgi:hypothetical protein